MNKDLALTFRPLADQVNASLTQERVVAMLAGFFGALALLLAGLGLYGVTLYAVSRRRTEIGIRMALGAAPRGVVRLVLSRVTLLVGIGVLVGAGVSVWAAKFVETLLYGLEPRDPVTLVGAAVVLATVGAAAGWLPAYRAHGSIRPRSSGTARRNANCRMQIANWTSAARRKTLTQPAQAVVDLRQRNHAVADDEPRRRRLLEREA